MNKNQEEEALYFHVYNRGVEKRDIFMDKSDYYRFIHDLYEFNDSQPANPHFGRLTGGSPTSTSNKERKCLVTILCFCLIPNHYHLLLSAPNKEAVTIFMRKIGTGYTNYFNAKQDRVGPLFQGKYKSIQIKNDEYLKHLSRYIHLNPKRIKRLHKIHLSDYKFSSYLDYIGTKNLPSLIDTSFILDLFSSRNEYQEFMQNSTTSPLTKHEKID